MELALSLGDARKPFSLLDKSTSTSRMASNKELGFCMSLGNETLGSSYQIKETHKDERSRASSEAPVQLDLLPFSPVPRSQPSSQLLLPWLTNQSSSVDGVGGSGLGLNRQATAEEQEDTAAGVSSPDSTLFSFQMDFGRNKREAEVEQERASSRTSDDDGENGSTRKKLRLSKEQSAFLEENFKEHSTLNPKQKLALARQLNLRPRQVEVWFQNRRARTKLKQTEVDCEYLKRCCETLTEENRRLQKELQELRALKTSQPFYMQLPATTLTMCPSCERVATTTSTTTTVGNPTSLAADKLGSSKLFPLHNAGSSNPK